MDEKTLDKMRRALEQLENAQAIAEELWPTEASDTDTDTEETPCPRNN